MLDVDNGLANVLYAVAFFAMVAACVVELKDNGRRLSWALLVSAAWAVVMFVWWRQ